MSIYLDKAKLFHKAIHRILIEEWDPIGVGDILEAQDEYDSYIPQIYKMLISRKPEYEIFKYLWLLETDHMGLSGNRQQTEQCAERLFNLPKEIV